MSDLIDRTAAIERINKQREHLHPNIYPQDEIGDAAYRICVEFIERLPSAEPEIIKCKDCKHMKEHYDGTNNVPYLTCYEWGSETDYDGFCHYAERRTDVTLNRC